MTGNPLLMMPHEAAEPPPGAAPYPEITPGVGEQAAASFEEGPTSETAKFSLPRFFNEAQYRDDFWGRFGRGAMQAMEGQQATESFRPVDTSIGELKESPLLSADEVNKKYAPIGPDGKPEKLTDKPLPEAVAQMRYEARKAQIDREGIFRRAEATRGVVPNFVINMAQMLDPLNLSTMFLPGLGEERLIGALAERGLEGIAARTGARVVAGAATGATAMAPIAALQGVLGAAEDQDFGIRDFMRDVMMGAAFGAAVHGGIVGPYREWRYGRYPGGPPPGGGGPGGGAATSEPTEPQFMGPMGPFRRERPAPTVTDVEDLNEQRRIGAPSRYHVDEEYERLRGEDKNATYEDAQANVFARETEPFREETRRDLGLTEEDTENWSRYYDRAANEPPREAFHRATSELIDDSMRAELRELTPDPELQREAEEFLAGDQAWIGEEGAGYGYMQRGFHTTFGPTQGWRSIYGPSPLWEQLQRERAFHAASDPPFETVLNADANTKHAAMGAAVAQILEGRPVDTVPIFSGIFHGSSEPNLQPSNAHYSTMNIYGQGFYTTDSAAIAGGYSKKGSKRTGERNIYHVRENRPLKLLDGEAPITPEIAAIMRKSNDGVVLDALEEKHVKNVRQLYDEIRDSGTNEGMSADDIQGIFESLTENLKDAGYDGLTHLGGLKTGKPAHTVRIYFNPERDISIEKRPYTPAEVASQQQQVWRDGFAPTMPQPEFDAAKEAVYPKEGTPNAESAKRSTAEVRERELERSAAIARSAREAAENRAARERAGEAGGAEPGGGAGPAGAEGTGGANAVRTAGEEGTSAGGGASEPGAEGKPQQLIPGVDPITDRERAAFGMNKPMKGGNAPIEEGLFDVSGRGQAEAFNKIAEKDPELALALRDLQGLPLTERDIAEIKDAVTGVEKAEDMEDAAVQAADCIIRGEGG